MPIAHNNMWLSWCWPLPTTTTMEWPPWFMIMVVVVVRRRSVGSSKLECWESGVALLLSLIANMYPAISKTVRTSWYLGYIRNNVL